MQITIWRSALINEKVIEALVGYIPLAPLHNPAYIASIRAFQDLLPIGNATDDDEGSGW